MGFWSRQASTTTDSDQGNPSRRQARQAYSNGHTATATTYKQAYSNGRTATATTYNDERNPRKEGFRAMRDPRRRRSTCTHRERRRARWRMAKRNLETATRRWPRRSPFSSPTPWPRPVVRPSSLRMGQPLALTPWQEVASHWQEVASSVGLKMEGAFRSTAMTRS